MAKTVLIVEDNELNMKLFHDLLEAHGIDTLETKDGHNVLDLAREHKPDLILMDIQLPEVSGLDVTKWLKADEELKSIPVIAITAFAMKGDEQKIREGGCEDYISKPISVTHFLEMINYYLDKPGADAAEQSAEAESSDQSSSVSSDEGEGAADEDVKEEGADDKSADDGAANDEATVEAVTDSALDTDTDDKKLSIKD